MPKEIIHTDQAPAAIGPYAQAIRVGNLIYTAGQGGLDPATGKLAEGVEAQAEQTMKNLAAVLEAAGSSFDQVVKTTIFLRYIKDFAAVNEVYASFFEEGNFPARSTVAAAALPMGALVEIEMVAEVAGTREAKSKKKSKAKKVSKAKKGKKLKKLEQKGKKKKNDKK